MNHLDISKKLLDLYKSVQDVPTDEAVAQMATAHALIAIAEQLERLADIKESEHNLKQSQEIWG